MEPSSAQFVVQRQTNAGEEWKPVTACNSLDYARIVARTGLRLHFAASYRAVHSQTGSDIELGFETSAAA